MLTALHAHDFMNGRCFKYTENEVFLERVYIENNMWTNQIIIFLVKTGRSKRDVFNEQIKILSIKKSVLIAIKVYKLLVTKTAK